MTTDKTQPKLNIYIYRKSINQVTEFVYLCYKLSSSSNNQEVAMKHRIGLGWAAFGKHETTRKSKMVPIHIKTRIYETYILPVLYALIASHGTRNSPKKLKSSKTISCVL